MGKERWFKVTIDSAGYIREHADGWDSEGGIGWGILEIDTPHYQKQLKSTVVVTTSGKVYASREVLDSVDDVRGSLFRGIKIGRRQMWRIDDEKIADLKDFNSYERRSDREREVQQRNNELIEWLEGLV
jgi:hypothetical protein